MWTSAFWSWWEMRKFDRQRTGIWCDRHWEFLRRATRDGADLDIAFLETGMAYLATRAAVPVHRFCCKLESPVLYGMIERSDKMQWPRLLDEMQVKQRPITTAEEFELGRWAAS